MLTKEKIIERATTGQRESANLDFKSEFDPGSKLEWCEIIKDIVAMANSGGGVIVFGVNNDGSRSKYDISELLSLDDADITNKVEAYTGYQFSEFEMVEIKRKRSRVAALLIFGLNCPMVFRRNGAHTDERKSKPAFLSGTVYFRHGAKSEPCRRDDLMAWKDRELASVRDDWLGGIRQVVEAPRGHKVVMVSADEAQGTVHAKISNATDAVPMRPENPEAHWPFRQSQLVEKIEQQLPDGVKFNGHDVLSIKTMHGINAESHPNFVFKPHKMASPQYSENFANWILEQFREDKEFFAKAREFWRLNH